MHERLREHQGDHLAGFHQEDKEESAAFDALKRNDARRHLRNRTKKSKPSGKKEPEIIVAQKDSLNDFHPEPESIMDDEDRVDASPELESKATPDIVEDLKSVAGDEADSHTHTFEKKKYGHPNQDRELRELVVNTEATDQDWEKFVLADPDRTNHYLVFANSNLKDKLHRAQMRIAHKHEVVHHAELSELEDILRLHRITFLRGHKFTQDENAQAAQVLADAAKQLPGDAELILKPAEENHERPNDPHGIVEFDRNATVENLTAFLNQIIARRQKVAQPEAKTMPDMVEDLEKVGDDELQPVEQTPVVAAEIPQPESEPVPMDPLLARLDQARQKMHRLEAQLGTVEGHTHGLVDKLRDKFKSGSRKEQTAELETARVEYQLARAEYIGKNLENFLEERIEAVNSRLKAFNEQRKESKVHKLEGALKWYKALPAKYRLATSAGLLLGGLAMPIAAPALYGIRGASSFLMTSKGSFDLMESLRRHARNSRYKADLKNETFTDYTRIEDRLAEIESQALLDGKTFDDLKNNTIYQDLFDRYQYNLRSAHEGQTSAEQQNQGNQVQDFFKHSLENVDGALKYQLKTESNMRNASKVASVIFGGLVSTGALASVIRKMENLDPTISPHAALKYAEVPDHPFKPGAGAFELNVGHAPMDVELSNATSIEITNRGVEGTLIDASKTNPKILEWLHQQYPNSKGDTGSLVHRFVTEHTDGHNMDKVLSGEIRIGTDGSIILDADNIKFAKTLVREAVDAKPTNLSELNPRFGLDDTDKRIEKISPGFESPHPPPDTDVDLNAEAVIRSPEAKVPTLEEARFEAAKSVNKTSDGLRLVLEGKYKKFINRELHISDKALNKIKHLNYKEFLNSMSISKRFSSDFKGLAEFFADKKIPLNASVHTKLIELAREWKSKN